MAAAMDLFVTILSAAGLKPSAVELDGRDLLPMLIDGAKSPRESFFYFRGAQLQAVREGKWKLRIARPASDWASPELTSGEVPVETELHDLSEDPAEKWNRAAEEPEIVASLRRRMIEFAERVGADLAWTLDSIEP
jgi:arylsulfatase A-like enzyme